MSGSVLSRGFTLQANTFAALGDKTRLSLIARLCQVSPQSISQLAEGTKITRQAVTKHLHILKKAGLVHSIRKGRETLFEFDATPIETMTEYLDLVSKQWDKKLIDLQNFLEE
ncbi:MAG: helix-turn-helix transcriptional regulator [Anaerolineales bacterium]|nr:helix-turn-helix transcriptional regulator [Anaerolineales bacterium]